jgi:hypothetical protein
MYVCIYIYLLKIFEHIDTVRHRAPWLVRWNMLLLTAFVLAAAEPDGSHEVDKSLGVHPWFHAINVTMKRNTFYKSGHKQAPSSCILFKWLPSGRIRGKEFISDNSQK